MIRDYLLVLILTYIEYFILWIILEHKYKITWDNIKFWLKYPPFICLFFYLIDSWFFATLIYTTFSYPYVLIAYCMKNVNREKFFINRVLVNEPRVLVSEIKIKQ